MRDVDRYATALRVLVLWIVPAGQLYEKTKIILSPTGATVKQRTGDGRVDTTRYKFEHRGVFEWVDE
jgi:hypothetical protein